MKHLAQAATLAAAISLAACSGDESSNQETQTSETAAPAAEESSAMDTAQEVATAVAEQAAEVAEALKLDTSSLESFQSSLAAMKGSLSDDQAGQLNNALASLAKGATEEGGGLLGAAQDIASGKSMEETLYEKLGDQLNGLTFEDILNLAG